MGIFVFIVGVVVIAPTFVSIVSLNCYWPGCCCLNCCPHLHFASSQLLLSFFSFCHRCHDDDVHRSRQSFLGSLANFLLLHDGIHAHRWKVHSQFTIIVIFIIIMLLILIIIIMLLMIIIRFVGKDQSVMAATCLSNPGLCLLVKSNGNWFFLQVGSSMSS